MYVLEESWSVNNRGRYHKLQLSDDYLHRSVARRLVAKCCVVCSCHHHSRCEVGVYNHSCLAHQVLSRHPLQAVTWWAWLSLIHWKSSHVDTCRTVILHSRVIYLNS